MRKYALPLCLILVTFISGAAADEPKPAGPLPGKPAWQQEYDMLASEPGAKTDSTKDKDGNEIRTVTLPGPIVMTYSIGKDGKATSAGEDQSGHAGVMCIWNLYTGLRGFLDICPRKNDAALKQMLDQTISRIDEFIVENNIPRTTKANLQIMADNQLRRVQTRLASMPKDKRAKACEGDASKMLDQMRTMPPEKFKKNIDDLLSTPRLPVMNPCM